MLEDTHYQLFHLLVKRKFPDIRFWSQYQILHQSLDRNCLLCDKTLLVKEHFYNDDIWRNNVEMHVLDHLREHNLLNFI